MRSLLPSPVRPMLACAGRPPTAPGWAFEFMWDGVRASVAVGGGRVRLTGRNGTDVTASYPEIAASGIGGGRSLLVDGELVALDREGRPDFGLLQQRMHVHAPDPELQGRVPVSLYVFDLLEIDGQRVLWEPYDVRRERLLELGLDRVPRVGVPSAFPGVVGEQLLAVARAHGLEGVVAKRRASRYEPGQRSPSWVTSALRTTQAVVVVGWTVAEEPRGATPDALLLGARDPSGRLRYLGHVRTGLGEAVLRDVVAQLEPLRRPDSPFDEDVPRQWAARARWVQPALVGEVEYGALTARGRLRHTAWRGLRPDREPEEILLLSR